MDQQTAGCAILLPESQDRTVEGRESFTTVPPNNVAALASCGRAEADLSVELVDPAVATSDRRRTRVKVDRPESFPRAQVTSEPEARVGQNLREANFARGQNDIVLESDPLVEVTELIRKLTRIRRNHRTIPLSTHM